MPDTNLHIKTHLETLADDLEAAKVSYRRLLTRLSSPNVIVCQFNHIQIIKSFEEVIAIEAIIAALNGVA